MTKLAANLTMLFTEVDFIERFGEAARAGFKGVEFLFPYAFEASHIAGRAITYAKALGVKQLNCLVGIKPSNVTDAAAYGSVVDNLKFAASALKAEGIVLLIEPINTFDIPGFYLTGTEQALNIIRETGSDNIKVQYDIYHMQRMEGELAATIKANLPMIGHIQLADNPGRFEPGTGEINYRYLFGMLDEIGYDGWIGCEYKPKAGTAAGLKWIAEHGL
jgi:hydroxypyruvate isomerase